MKKIFYICSQRNWNIFQDTFKSQSRVGKLTRDRVVLPGVDYQFIDSSSDDGALIARMRGNNIDEIILADSSALTFIRCLDEDTYASMIPALPWS